MFWLYALKPELKSFLYIIFLVFLLIMCQSFLVIFKIFISICEYRSNHMRKKSKNFRVDSRARAASMVKFSARSDSKNFPYKNWPSRVPIKSQKKFLCLIIISRPWGRICTFLDLFWTLLSVGYSYSVTSLTISSRRQRWINWIFWKI